jgi:hypothetical protein
MAVDLEKIEIINKSSLPEAEKKRLIAQILGVKDKKKREITTQQRTASIERLELARQVKRDKAASKPTNNPEVHVELDNKKIEDIFEKKYNGEFSKLTGLLMDLNNNIGEIKTMKKLKAEQKKKQEESKLVVEVPTVIKVDPVKLNVPNKIAIPNYRNNFIKKN